VYHEQRRSRRFIFNSYRDIPPGSPFDVMADGKQFIVNARLPPSINVIVNWTESSTESSGRRCEGCLRLACRAEAQASAQTRVREGW
jgi:hypothetical protein